MTVEINEICAQSMLTITASKVFRYKKRIPMRKPIIFSFANKVLALSTIKEKGILFAVPMFSKLMGYAPHPMRQALDELYRTHVLLSSGILEKNQSSLITFTNKVCPMQPSPVNTKFLANISQGLSKEIVESIPYLHLKYTPKREYEV